MSTLIRHKRATGSIKSSDKLKTGEIAVKGRTIGFGPVPTDADTDDNVDVLRILTEDDMPDGTGLYTSSATLYDSSTSVEISTISIPTGRTLKVGDFIIAVAQAGTLVFKISSIGSTTATIVFYSNLRGEAGFNGVSIWHLPLNLGEVSRWTGEISELTLGAFNIPVIPQKLDLVITNDGFLYRIERVYEPYYDMTYTDACFIGATFHYSTSSYTLASTSINLSTITTGTPKANDYILTSAGLLFRVTSVANSSASVSYCTTLKGSDGTDGADAETYELPIANSAALGGVKTGYSSSGSYYGLLADSTGNAYTAVPWQGVVSGISTQSLSGYSSITKNYLYLKKALPLYPNGTGNEILINWGWVTTTNKTATITYARSYSSEYTVNVFTSIVTTSDTQTTRISPNTRSGTGFSCPYNTGQQFFYLAIGYR